MKFIKVGDCLINVDYIVLISPYTFDEYEYYLELKTGTRMYLSENKYKEVLKNVLGKKKTRNNKK